MRTRNPDHRYRAIRSAQGEPDNALEAALWKILHGREVPGAVAWAYEIWEDLTQREIMQAWILARASDDAINRYLRVPEDVSQAYRHLFFDVDIFRDELDLLAWVSEYEENEVGTERGVMLLKAAVEEGPDKMAYLYGRGDAEMDPEKVQYVLMTEAYHRGRAHRGAPIASKEAQAAHAFMSTAIKTAQNVGKKGGPDLSSLRLKLKYTDQTEALNDAAERGEDILH